MTASAALLKVAGEPYAGHGGSALASDLPTSEDSDSDSSVRLVVKRTFLSVESCPGSPGRRHSDFQVAYKSAVEDARTAQVSDCAKGALDGAQTPAMPSLAEGTASELCTSAEAKLRSTQGAELEAAARAAGPRGGLTEMAEVACASAAGRRLSTASTMSLYTNRSDDDAFGVPLSYASSQTVTSLRSTESGEPLAAPMWQPPRHPPQYVPPGPLPHEPPQHAPQCSVGELPDFAAWNSADTPSGPFAPQGRQYAPPPPMHAASYQQVWWHGGPPLPCHPQHQGMRLGELAALREQGSSPERAQRLMRHEAQMAPLAAGPLQRGPPQRGVSTALGTVPACSPPPTPGALQPYLAPASRGGPPPVRPSEGADELMQGQRVHPSSRTTVMLKNLPPGLSREMLTDTLDKIGFERAYDFIYVPVSFRTRSSMCYAFVNVASPIDAQRMFVALADYTAWGMPSEKVCEVTWSDKLQGFSQHIARYRNSPLMHSTVPDEYKPAVYKDGRRTSFPPPTKSVRPPRILRPHSGGGGEGYED